MAFEQLDNGNTYIEVTSPRVSGGDVDVRISLNGQQFETLSTITLFEVELVSQSLYTGPVGGGSEVVLKVRFHPNSSAQELWSLEWQLDPSTPGLAPIDNVLHHNSTLNTFGADFPDWDPTFSLLYNHTEQLHFITMITPDLRAMSMLPKELQYNPRNMPPQERNIHPVALMMRYPGLNASLAPEIAYFKFYNLGTHRLSDPFPFSPNAGPVEGCTRILVVDPNPVFDKNDLKDYVPTFDTDMEPIFTCHCSGMSPNRRQEGSIGTPRATPVYQLLPLGSAHLHEDELFLLSQLITAFD